MPRSAYPLLGAAALLLCPASDPVDAQRRTPRALVERAVSALGGEAAARGVNSLSYDFVALNYQLGQEETPLSPARATIQNGRLVFDFANERRYQDVETRPGAGAAPPAPGSPPVAPARQRRVTLRDAGMIENNNQPAPEPAAQRSAARQGMRTLPHRLLLSALDRPDAVTGASARAFRGDTLDGVRYAAGPDTVTMYFDRIAGSLVLVETVADDPVLGDRRSTTIYTRWTPTGAILFPRQIDVDVNGRAASHTNIVAATTNESVSDAMFAVPDSILQRSRQAQPTTAISVTLAELGQGVWRAEGGSHHTLVVEQPRSLILVETPQNRARMSAVFDTLRARFPNKPVEIAINTHHHWDHSGGLRETMARGVSIVTHARNVDFVRGVATARKTVAPDNLSRLRRMPGVRGVRDSLTLGTGDRRIIVYPLPTAHAEGMLAAYVPSVGVLFTSDVVSPGPPNAPLPALGSTELVRFAAQRGLTPRRYAGGHGRVAEWDEITRAARP